MIDKVVCVLESYRRLRKREKLLFTCANTDIETLKGTNYDSVQAGENSAKFITGNNAIEFAAIKKIDLLRKAEHVKQLADDILLGIEELKKEKFGIEMYQIIKMKYLECKTYNQIQEEITEIEIATIHRRRQQALELLSENGFWSLYYKTNKEEQC